MKKVSYTNFELIEDVIKSIDIKQDESFKNIEAVNNLWKELVGEKIAEISKVYDIKGNTAEIVCADSFVANELYLEKENLLKKMDEKAKKMGIKIESIKFSYKKWKEKKDE